MRTRRLILFLALTALICGPFSAIDVIAEKKTMSLDGHAQALNLSKSVPDQLSYQGYLIDATDSSAVTATLEGTTPPQSEQSQPPAA